MSIVNYLSHFLPSLTDILMFTLFITFIGLINKFNKPLSTQSVGDLMKTLEDKYLYRFPKNGFILIRLDGRGFSNFTKIFKNSDSQNPFNPKFVHAMANTMNAMMIEFSAICGFCCSDEITLIIPSIKHQDSTHIFDGKSSKILSLTSAKCSVLFLQFILQEFKDDAKMQQAIWKALPCFDSRAIGIPESKKELILDNLKWRSGDCWRNTVSTVGRHILGKNRAKNMKCVKMIEEMRENKENKFDINSLPQYLLTGLLAKFKTTERKNDRGETYSRKELFNFDGDLKCSAEMTDFLLGPPLEVGELTQNMTTLNLHEVIMSSEHLKSA